MLGRIIPKMLVSFGHEVTLQKGSCVEDLVPNAAVFTARAFGK
jgi:hypothetical protein